MGLGDIILDRCSKTLYIKLHESQLIGRAVPGVELFDTAVQTDLVDPGLVARLFGHPRVIIGEFYTAEKVIAPMLRILCGPKALVKPAVIVHILHPFQEDLTLVEARGLMDVFLQGGARRVWLWMGRELADPEMLARRFPKEGWHCRDDDKIEMPLI